MGGMRLIGSAHRHGEGIKVPRPSFLIHEKNGALREERPAVGELFIIL
jgi:hypothetical protein